MPFDPRARLREIVFDATRQLAKTAGTDVQRNFDSPSQEEQDAA
jgi:hypothetical protein